MKKNVLFLFLSILTAIPSLSGQLGLNINYHKSDYTGWNDVLKEDGVDDYQIFNQIYQLGLDYGFSMKQYRVAFYPGFSYARGTYMYDDYTSTSNTFINFDLIQYGFYIRTHVYPLDLLSKKGMQCPSFHRGDEIFSKGWFITVQPEFLYSQKEMDGYRDFGTPFSLIKSSFVFGFGIGTGLDIGINDTFSLTPTLAYTFLLGEKWPGFSETFNQPSFNDGTAASYLSVGIRIGLWF